MMHYGLCLIAFMFIGASIFTILTCHKCEPFNTYIKSLDSKQQIIYTSIVEERRNVYIYGAILGAILACIFLFFVTLKPQSQSRNKQTFFSIAIAFSAIALLTQYIFYMLYPKQYMLPHLKNNEQIVGWLAVYRSMQYKYHLGMLLGIIGYFVFACGMIYHQ